MVASATIHATANITGELRLSLRFATDTETLRAAKKAAETPRLSVATNSRPYRKPCHHVTPLQPGFGGDTAVTVFTPLASSTVKEAAACLERDYGKRAVFVTGTLPGSTPEALQAIAKYSAYIVQQFKYWLDAKLPGSEHVLVWERQTRGALHLHACVASHDIAELRYIEKHFKIKWVLILQQVNRLAGVDLFARPQGTTWLGNHYDIRANARPVRESIRRYLSKYMSKNKISRANFLPELAGLKVFFPSRWWGISSTLRSKVVAARHTYTSKPLPLELALDCFEQIGAQVGTIAKKIVAFGNRYRPSDTTLVAFYDECDYERLWNIFEPWIDRIKILPVLQLANSTTVIVPSLPLPYDQVAWWQKWREFGLIA